MFQEANVGHATELYHKEVGEACRIGDILNFISFFPVRWHFTCGTALICHL